jgi:hypothetical protein
LKRIAINLIERNLARFSPFDLGRRRSRGSLNTRKKGIKAFPQGAALCVNCGGCHLSKSFIRHSVQVVLESAFVKGNSVDFSDRQE